MLSSQFPKNPSSRTIIIDRIFDLITRNKRKREIKARTKSYFCPTIAMLNKIGDTDIKENMKMSCKRFSDNFTIIIPLKKTLA